MRRFRPPNSRLYAALSGALLVLAAPPVDWFILAWVGLTPLFIALEKPSRNGFGEGFTAGAVFNAGILYWLAFNTGTYPAVAALTMFSAAIILATAWGVAAWVFVKMRQTLGALAWIFLPLSWCAWEGWLSHLGELAFPWPLLALTQNGCNPILQVMEFTGVWGVSFWVAAVNGSVYLILRNSSQNIKRGAIAALTILATIPFISEGLARRWDKGDPQPSINIAVIQGNLDPLEKWTEGAEGSWAAYDSLTRLAAREGIQLAVWPETALPAHLRMQSLMSQRLRELCREQGVYVLTGASDYARLKGEARPLNSAFLMSPDRGLIDVYSKRHLVPFGERVPFQSICPSLGELNFGQAEFLPGLRQTIFEVPVGTDTARFGALICFESAIPNLTRQAVKKGANLLVTISNDAWYGRSSEPAQISALSRFRCIETRRAMARASNTGISFLADQRGRILEKTSIYVPAWRTAWLPLINRQTFYVRHGDIFLSIVTLIYGIGLIWTVFKLLKYPAET
ncbi:MAG: apolipoprotein N-acyltransferase [Calditrichota bacterium]